MKDLFTSKLARIAGVVAVAAVLVPAAHAAIPSPDYFPEVQRSLQPVAVPSPDYFPEVSRSLQTSAQRPDDRGSWATVHGVQTSGAATVVAESSDDGFNWGDGGIGAGGVLTLALIAFGSAVVVRRNRNRPASA